MIRSIIVVAVMCLCGPATAQTWQPLNGPAIRTALEGRTLVYASAWQDFRASGRTLYNAGADSWGYWRVEGNTYCSQWPPSDLWACYSVAQRGTDIRFTGPGGDTSIGRFKSD